VELKGLHDGGLRHGLRLPKRKQRHDGGLRHGLRLPKRKQRHDGGLRLQRQELVAKALQIVVVADHNHKINHRDVEEVLQMRKYEWGTQMGKAAVLFYLGYSVHSNTIVPIAEADPPTSDWKT
jgi:hypothetical protein